MMKTITASKMIFLTLNSNNLLTNNLPKNKFVYNNNVQDTSVASLI